MFNENNFNTHPLIFRFLFYYYLSVLYIIFLFFLLPLYFSVFFITFLRYLFPFCVIYFCCFEIFRNAFTLSSSESNQRLRCWIMSFEDCISLILPVIFSSLQGSQKMLLLELHAFYSRKDFPLITLCTTILCTL